MNKVTKKIDKILETLKKLNDEDNIATFSPEKDIVLWADTKSGDVLLAFNNDTGQVITHRNYDLKRGKFAMFASKNPETLH